MWRRPGPWRSRRRHPGRLATAWTVLLGADVRPRVMTAVVLALTVTGVAVFWGFAGLGLDLVDSIYVTVTIITTTGFGDSNLGEAPPVLQLYGVALMPAGTAAHVVMCGLGNIGHRMVEELHELGRVLAWTEAGVHAGRHGRP